MKTAKISAFKAQCIELLKEVNSSRKPLVVTLRGRPLVQIQPIDHVGPQLGGLRGQVLIRGDIVKVDWSKDWEEE